MKKYFALLAVLMLAALFTGCGRATPGPGEEIVLIQKPMFFGHGGVLEQPVKTGSMFIALTTDEVKVNVQPEQYNVHFDDLMSSDGVPLDFDAVIRLQTTDSVRLIRDFGEKWYEKNVEAEFRNRVRQAVRKHGMNETAINTSAIEEIDNEVSSAMEKYVKDANLPVRLIQVTVGRANPPDSIKHQRIETAAQEQRVNTEKQRKLAEDQRKASEQSRAEADNAYRQAMSLSPEQYLALETIKMQRDACAAGHCTFLIGGKATPVLNVK